MNDAVLPLIVEPEELESRLGDADVLVIDLSKAETYRQYHISGAVHLDYPQIIAGRKPVMGLLPPDEQLSRVFASIGLTPEQHVVAYDDEGGGKACRLLWTLATIGHTRHSLLNGGLIAWANEHHRMTNEPTPVTPSDYPVARHHPDAIADSAYILSRLNAPDLGLLDARTPEEYAGIKCYAQRGGHIPGAVNLDWMAGMDRDRNARLLPQETLRPMLAERGLTPDKEIIVYCQTHHRSAFSYVMLKYLGYERVRGYPGSWSEWGNLPDTPIEK